MSPNQKLNSNGLKKYGLQQLFSTPNESQIKAINSPVKKWSTHERENPKVYKRKSWYFFSWVNAYYSQEIVLLQTSKKTETNKREEENDDTSSFAIEDILKMSKLKGARTSTASRWV